MASFFISVLTGGVLGFVLYTANIGVTNWRFLAVMVCVAVTGLASRS